MGGYIARVLHQKLVKSTNEMKEELCACLSEMNDVDPDEMSDDSDEWMAFTDRGSLKHITKLTWCTCYFLVLSLF